MIGLIFGDSDFPKEVLKKIKRKKFKYLIIDLSKKRSFKKDNNSKRVSIGQFGKIINLLKEKKCKKVLFAGKVEKPKFSLYKFFELNQPVIGPPKKPMEGELSFSLKEDGGLDILDSSTNFEPSLYDNLGQIIDTKKEYTMEIIKWLAW